MNKRPRFGLIGTGVWSRLVQGPAAAASEDVTFSAVFGRDVRKAEAIATPLGTRAYGELDAFLAAVDIVGISVAPDAQVAFALAAAKAGKPVILEKPLAIDPKAAEAIATEFESRGVPALVFFTMLFIPRVRRWLGEAAATGGWITGRIDSFSRVLVDPASPFHETAWRAGVGALWDTGPHAVAMLATVLGEITEVAASGGQGDLKAVTLTHRSGAVSTITLAMDAPGPMPGETAFFGAAGKLVQPPSPDWNGEAMEAYGVALRALASGDIAAFPNARFGAMVTQVLAAAERSIASGRREAVA